MKNRFQVLVNLKLGIIIFVTCLPLFSKAQVPYPALVGYFHNWQDPNVPYVQLNQVDSRYNIIDVAFAIAKPGTDYKMEFTPDNVSKASFISQIKTVQAQGRKVIISMGGATSPISLDNTIERDTFISTMTTIINTYGFDGIDIDFEGSSLSLSGGTISAPIDQPIINLIYAIKKIMANYYLQNNRQLILTMAPETAFVQGGQSSYGGIWGAYLPVIHALRDSIAIMHVQLYNSGTMYGIDRGIYTQGTADFIVAMCEAVIQGFNTNGGFFIGLPASKIAAGLPACTLAAGGGFTDTATVRVAMNYLRGIGSKPGTYTLVKPGGYPNLKGMMTWSLNWDATATCGSKYEFANNYQSIFGNITSVSTLKNAEMNISVHPNPLLEYSKIEFDFSELVTFELYDSQGKLIVNTTYNNISEIILSKTDVPISGLYLFRLKADGKYYSGKLVVE